MQSQTNESALGATVEKQLTCTILEELKEQNIDIRSVNERFEFYRSP
jgi:hypothetical protein